MPRLPRILVDAPPPEVVIITEENDLVIILGVLFCTLICVVGLLAAGRCALHLCIWGPLGNTSESTPADKGVKKKVLKSLPIINYTPTNTTPVNQQPALDITECTVCLAEFAEGDEMRVLPQCGHGFHVGCIDKWLKSHSSCPSCRQGVGKSNKSSKLSGKAEMEASTSNDTETTFLP